MNGKSIVLWVLQIAVAGLLLMAGWGKLTGAPMHVALFEAIGIGQWFQYFTGAVEVGGALLLLVPPLVSYAAVALAVVMTGAVLTHLFIIGGSAAIPLVLLAVLGTILWLRRDEFRALVHA